MCGRDRGQRERTAWVGTLRDLTGLRLRVRRGFVARCAIDDAKTFVSC